MRMPRMLAGVFVLTLPVGAHAVSLTRVPMNVPAVSGAAGAAAGAAVRTQLSASPALLPLGSSLPSASEAPELVLSVISSRYGTDPSSENIADLGEGDQAEVRSGVLPADASLTGAALPAEPGQGVAVKIPYIDPGGMPAHEADVSRRLQEAGGGDLFLRGAHDPELNVLVMEKLAGYQTLDEWMLARSRIGPRTYKRIASQLRRGLEVLEKAGVVHSDLRPENLMIGPHLRVKIIDYGISADEGGYMPYPGYEGWRGGLVPYVSENQLHNGPAAPEDDRHSVEEVLRRLHHLIRTP